ncbi:DUF4007 family protein [Rhodococcus aetherivorans]|uniref:DUF4007 family protein n=1 Tax=Rhodococcus aetherivorans TaxID=191292 RepID=UPI001E38B292|nr:DUF4007 family protein [Rhodococcus aetherivorans]UGQ39588.1 DUF4007 family protein [Rhodococcus aetherivorans]
MTLEQVAIPTFANHQTFHPRFGWIKKGYDAAVADPDIFNIPNAPVTLGVGKNMVDAIRFWSTATKVVTRVPHPEKSRVTRSVPTRFGYAILDDRRGFDPYMEDTTTLWLLHWQAVSAPSFLPVWRIAFNDFSAVEFTEEELQSFCIDEIAATTWSKPRDSSIHKDVDCLLRMYTRRDTKGRQTLDDLLDSPFRELQLIQPSPGSRKSYRFVRGDKKGLSPTAITYACLDYMEKNDRGNRTVSSTRLALDPGSPGRLLKITEHEIVDALESASREAGGFRVARPAGSRQLVVDNQPALAALAVLASHYRKLDLTLKLDDLEVAGHSAMQPLYSDFLTNPEESIYSGRTGSKRGKKGTVA